MNGQYPGYSPLDGMELGILETVDEVDDNFEPLTRARSNTWPLPRPENYDGPSEDGTSQAGAGAAAGTPNIANSGTTGNKCSVRVPLPGLPTKKNSSRRNAWGNLSYADLITQAINSSPEHRLTLSQIYEWMVQNVNYFKDKGDSNSSAGWKNSIRHNLSLHSRFMRVQNEGTGKSSWWMIDPDAKPGKSVRRRAASMETSKYEKRRGRAKKKVEVLRNGTLSDQPISPSSSVSESADHFPDSPRHSSGSFQLSPESRPRAYSNPSVFSGGGFQLSGDFRGRTSSQSSAARLTPLQSVNVENEWATGFNNGNFNGADLVNGTTSTSGSYSAADQLAGNLAQGMKIQSESFLGYVNEPNAQNPPGTPFNSTLYNEQFQNRDFHSIQSNSPNICGIHRLQQCSCLTACIKVERMSPPYSEQSPDSMATQQYMSSTRIAHRPQSASPPLSNRAQEAPSTMMGQYIGALSVSDDLNINVDSLPGGFDCNVDDIIQHELNTEGCLDFNFTSQQQALAQHANDTALGIHHHHHIPPTAVTVSYQQSPSASPSWES